MQSYEKQQPLALAPPETPTALAVRGTKRPLKDLKDTKLRCYFCDKRGHVQAACVQYLKARDKTRRRGRGRKDVTSSSDSEESKSESESDDRRSKDKSRGKGKGKDKRKDKEAHARVAMTVYGRDDVIDL